MDMILSLQRMRAPARHVVAMFSTRSVACSAPSVATTCGPVYTDPTGAA